MSAFIGIDLAWSEGSATRRPNETGLVALDPLGRAVAAGWARGLDDVERWVLDHLGERTVIGVDASLVVTNATGMREPEKQVGRAYGRWRVAANATNLALPHQAGARLLERFDAAGIGYVAATAELRARTGPVVFECYPYTTLVGVEELGYDDERPRYKRLVPGMSRADARRERAAACDDLIQRLSALPGDRHRRPPLDPPLDLSTDPETARLIAQPSPIDDVPYKHREDLLDAAICAWTAAFWERWGDDRVQVLGDPDDVDARGRRAALVAAARESQRLGRRV